MSSSMRATSAPYAGDVTPQQAWDALASDSAAVLVDVRTSDEWVRVGVPNLASIGKKVQFVSLILSPDFNENPNFTSELTASLPEKEAAVYFLCKAGGRSASAAAFATHLGYKNCYNIVGGFEGSPQQSGQATGWKAQSLPWEQA